MPHLLYNPTNKKYWSGNSWTKRSTSAQEYPTQSAAEAVRQALLKRHKATSISVIHRKHLSFHPKGPTHPARRRDTPEEN